MVPLILLSVLAVVLVVAVLAVASGRVEVDPLAEAVRSTPDHGLPPAPRAADVEGVRFDTALRGYRMDEVDARLTELRDELAEREAVLGRLRAEGPPGEPGHRTVEEPPAEQDRWPVEQQDRRPVEQQDRQPVDGEPTAAHPPDGR